MSEARFHKGDPINGKKRTAKKLRTSKRNYESFIYRDKKKVK